MKNVLRNVGVAILVVLFSGNIAAKELPGVKQMNTPQIEKNLLMGVSNGNTGLKVSAAYHLGEIKSEKAVLPLIKMLRDSSVEEERIAAALSLSKIGSEKAMFFVKGAAKFDSSKRVRELCSKFYVNSIKG